MGVACCLFPACNAYFSVFITASNLEETEFQASLAVSSPLSSPKLLVVSVEGRTFRSKSRRMSAGLYLAGELPIFTGEGQTRK